MSEDKGASWKRLNGGLSDTSIHVFTVNNMNIFAGTGRQGVWISAWSDIFTMETNPDTLVLNREAGGKKPVFIITSVEWALQGFMPNWLSVSKTSGTGNDSLVFQSLQANTASGPRNAVFYLFSPKAKTITFMVSQRGVTDAVAENDDVQLKVFPNPASGNFQVNSPFRIKKIRICNPEGDAVREFLPESSEVMIDMSEDARGLYFMSVFLENATLTRKLLLR
jgi:hypothetical protein